MVSQCQLVAVLICIIGHVNLGTASKNLPPDWHESVDNATQKVYYWNSITGESTWERPFYLNIIEIDDADDLLGGTGIERHDLKVLLRDETDDYIEEDNWDNVTVDLPLAYERVVST